MEFVLRQKAQQYTEYPIPSNNCEPVNKLHYENLFGDHHNNNNTTSPSLQNLPMALFVIYCAVNFPLLVELNVNPVPLRGILSHSHPFLIFEAARQKQQQHKNNPTEQEPKFRIQSLEKSDNYV